MKINLGKLFKFAVMVFILGWIEYFGLKVCSDNFAWLLYLPMRFGGIITMFYTKEITDWVMGK